MSKEIPLTKADIRDWFTAGWRGLPIPEESGHPEFAWELGEASRRDSTDPATYTKSTIEEAFEDIYEYHFEDLVKDNDEEKEEFPQEWTEHIEEIIEGFFKRNPDKRKH